MNATRRAIADWSTINLAALTRLPRYTLPPTYHLQSDMGNGCAGDPPGYPTYFTRAVYTKYGNTPRNAPFYVIQAPNGYLYDASGARSMNHCCDQKWDRLWVRPDINHPRVQAWIRSTFLHHKHCYQVPALRAAGKNWSDAMLIWPDGCLGKTPLGDLRDVSFETDYARKHRDYDKWTEEHRTAFVKEIELENQRIIAECSAVATPENHDGTIIVREHYPEFQPTDELLAAKYDHPGNWWEIMAQRPNPESCPGQYGMAHPVNGSRCQMCGWQV